MRRASSTPLLTHDEFYRAQAIAKQQLELIRRQAEASSGKIDAATKEHAMQIHPFTVVNNREDLFALIGQHLQFYSRYIRMTLLQDSTE